MAGLFVTSRSQRRHGVFALNVKGTPVFTPRGTGVAALVGNFPWGPSQELVTPAGLKERWDMFCPPGMDHLSTGYMAANRKAWPTLKIVRACSATAATATCALVDGSGTIVTVNAKYPGAAINTVGTCVVSDATDGNANHFNLLVGVTGDSGSTYDEFVNIDATGTEVSASGVDNALLVGSFTLTTAGRPLNATYTFSGGTSPALIASDYVGTAGTGDRCLSLLEGDPSIKSFFADDCGDSIRAAVNAGIGGHPAGGDSADHYIVHGDPVDYQCRR